MQCCCGAGQPCSYCGVDVEPPSTAHLRPSVTIPVQGPCTLRFHLPTVTGLEMVLLPSALNDLLSGTASSISLSEYPIHSPPSSCSCWAELPRSCTPWCGDSPGPLDPLGLTHHSCRSLLLSTDPCTETPCPLIPTFHPSVSYPLLPSSSPLLPPGIKNSA